MELNKKNKKLYIVIYILNYVLFCLYLRHNIIMLVLISSLYNVYCNIFISSFEISNLLTSFVIISCITNYYIITSYITTSNIIIISITPSFKIKNINK